MLRPLFLGHEIWSLSGKTTDCISLIRKARPGWRLVGQSRQEENNQMDQN